MMAMASNGHLGDHFSSRATCGGRVKDILLDTNTTSDTKELGYESDLVCGLDFDTELACDHPMLVLVDLSQGTARRTHLHDWA